MIDTSVHTVRADHVGSLLRTPALLDARAAFRQGKLDRKGLTAAEDKAILEVLDLQRQAGFTIFTDGEYRRELYFSILWEAVEGFSSEEAGTAGGLAWHEPDGHVAADVPNLNMPAAVIGKLRKTRRLVGQEIAFLKEHVSGAFKVTLPAPGHFTALFQPGTAYASPMDLKSDIVDILREEAEDAVKDGTPYLQIDAPTFTFLSDTGVAAGFSQASGLSVDQLLDIEIADMNQLVSGVRRDGVTLGLHLCRGNHGQYWLNTGGYEPIAEKLFNQLDFNRFLLEYDSERAGGFEPLRFVPKGKVAVLGLVSTKIGELESRDTLRRRIDEASKYLPVEQLAISPQCGFSSAALDRCCTWEQQRQKLELVASVAREVWG